MYPTARERCETKLDHIDHVCRRVVCERGENTMGEATLTVVEDIEHLGSSVLCNAGK